MSQFKIWEIIEEKYKISKNQKLGKGRWFNFMEKLNVKEEK